MQNIAKTYALCDIDAHDIGQFAESLEQLEADLAECEDLVTPRARQIALAAFHRPELRDSSYPYNQEQAKAAP